VQRDVPTLGSVQQILDGHRAAQGKPPAAITRFTSNPKAATVVVQPHRLDTYDKLRTETHDEND
jgi:hypothetical protein